jgi:hypothetical protein
MYFKKAVDSKLFNQRIRQILQDMEDLNEDILKEESSPAIQGKISK